MNLTTLSRIRDSLKFLLEPGNWWEDTEILEKALKKVEKEIKEWNQKNKLLIQSYPRN